MLKDIVDALATRDRARVNAAVAAELESASPLGDQWRKVAQVAEQNGELSQALAAVDAMERELGRSARSVLDRASLLSRAGRDAEALALVDALPADAADPFSHAYLVGTLAANTGDFERAGAELRKAIALRPSSGQAWFALSTLGALDPDLADALRSNESAFDGADAVEAGAYFHCLAQLRHREGDHAGAFAAFERSARSMRRVRPFDAGARERALTALTRDWDSGALSRFTVERPSGPAPIFVTGLPRSGTTLTEQILVAHPDVAAGAEVELFPTLFRDCGSASVANLTSYAAKHGSLAPLRTLYQHLLAERFPGVTGRIVDKSVLGSSHLGLVAALFPDAPIVWLRRDAADNAWSTFSSFFLRGLNWSWSLADIAGVIASEDRLLARWQDVLGDRLTVLPYASLVTEPEAEIRRLDAACGLEFEAGQLTPHTEGRAVKTASLAQVRQPINRKGLDSSAPYHPFMGEFFERYPAA